MKQHLPVVFLVFLAWAPAAVSQGGKGPQGNPYETCIAAEVAKAGGGMVAEAKARRACRERFPDQAVEANRVRAADSVPAGAGASGALPGGATGSPTMAGTTGGGATPSSSVPPTTSSAPSTAPTPMPIPAPGASGGNPHGGPPGQAKK